MNYNLTEMQCKKIDLSNSFNLLESKIKDFNDSCSQLKMEREEIESLIKQINRLNDKLSYWIKYPHTKIRS